MSFENEEEKRKLNKAAALTLLKATTMLTALDRLLGAQRRQAGVRVRVELGFREGLDPERRMRWKVLASLAVTVVVECWDEIFPRARLHGLT